ncbi:hypothetical protein AAHH76_17475 [Bacillus toyonensis]
MSSTVLTEYGVLFRGFTDYVGYIKSPINIQAIPIRIKDLSVIQNFFLAFEILKSLFVRAEINPLQDRGKQLDQEIKSTKGIYYESKEEIEITFEYLRKEIDNDDDESQQIITDYKEVS